MSSLYRFLRLPASYRKFRRYKDIAAILARHGLADVTSRTRVGRVLRTAGKVASLGFWKEKEAIPLGERLRTICEELGPTFVKFGQMMANRPDLLPPEVVMELSRLQDQVPPFPFETVREILASAWPRPLGDVLAAIDETALAAASIAQVHRATLKGGEQVVIKIKRPGLERVVRQDLAVLRDIAAYVEHNFERLEHFRPMAIVEEFARTFTLEMDLRNEVHNMERYARNFKDDPAVRIPAAHKELCSPDVIVMEYLEGTKITQVTDWEHFPLTPKQVADIGTGHLLRSVFEFRFFHADPHPGNFVIAKDGTVCLLDFGMMGYVDEARLEEMLGFMVALVSQDTQMLIETILESGLAPAGLDLRSFKRDVEFMMNQFARLSLDELDLESLMRTAIETIARHRIALPEDLLMVGRALTTIEGIARRIYPEFKPLEAVQPYLVAMFLKRALDPTLQSTQLVETFSSWATLAKKMPQDLSSVVSQLRRGDLTIRTEDVHAVPLAAERTRGLNRLTGALLAGAGVAGSFLLAALPGSPDWLPVASLSGSFLLALWVILGLRRSGGM